MEKSEEQRAAEIDDEIDDFVADEMECIVVSSLHPQKWTTGEERRRALDALKIGPNKDDDDPTFGQRTR